MKKLVSVLLVVGLLGGCVEYDTNRSTYSGDAKFDTVCVDGVEYLMHDMGHRGYMSPHYYPDGELYTCQK